MVAKRNLLINWDCVPDSYYLDPRTREDHENCYDRNPVGGENYLSHYTYKRYQDEGLTPFTMRIDRDD